MPLNISVVDAFTDSLFGGNPAAVIVLDAWLPDAKMQAIAAENNLSETAFVVPIEEGCFYIRWFSPLTEIAFCGHATLAAAFVLFKQYPLRSDVTFVVREWGECKVTQDSSGKIHMDFPNTKPRPVSDIPEALVKGLSIAPTEVYCNSQAYFVVYARESYVHEVLRDNAELKRLKPRDVVVTCRAEQPPYDFVSRYFWPANGGDEDPVTGSIHTGLAPLWAERLGKSDLMAYQASARGGVLSCRVTDERVFISGNAVLYLQGEITV